MEQKDEARLEGVWKAADALVCAFIAHKLPATKRTHGLFVTHNTVSAIDPMVAYRVTIEEVPIETYCAETGSIPMW